MLITAGVMMLYNYRCDGAGDSPGEETTGPPVPRSASQTLLRGQGG